jgi:uncharacterized protein YbjT (DUF2867 family)
MRDVVMRVLVVGATGTTGSEVLSQLRADGVAVRAVTRSGESAARLREQGIDAVVADLSDPESLPGALAGIDSVYVASPASPDLAEREGALAAAAVRAGVRHLVKLSVIGSLPDSPIAFGRMHHAAEQAVGASGIPCTMIRPNGFMQNTLAWAGQIATGTVYGPVMDAQWSIVDVRDVAAVAVAALKDPDAHAAKAYTATGPDASSPREQIAILGEILGREILVQEVSIEQAKLSMLEAGWPEWNVERMGELFKLYADGLAEQTSPDILAVTGVAPRDFRRFASDQRRSFGG